MRYGIALMLGILIVGIGALFVLDTNHWFDQNLRQELREGNLEGVDLELSTGDQLRMSIANVMMVWSFVLIPTILVGSLGVAWLLPRSEKGCLGPGAP